MEAQSAGLSTPWTWRQLQLGIASDISATRFCTKGVNRLEFPRSHPSTTRLSVQAYMFVNGMASTTPLHNSKRGIVNRLIGATFDLAITKDTCILFQESMALRYTTPVYATSEASQNPCNWMLTMQSYREIRSVIR